MTEKREEKRRGEEVDAPSSPEIPPISLYSKNGCDISLSEKRPAARDGSLFAKRMLRPFMYIGETDTGREMNRR